MTEPKFTPGPWSHRNGRIFQTDRENLTIANVARAYDGDYSPMNGDLLAAAPELYEALEAVIYVQTEHEGRPISTHTQHKSGTCQWRIDAMEAYTKARAALAKARGESHD